MAAALVFQSFQDLHADLTGVLVNLGGVLLLGQILSWHYLRFAPVLSNKRKFARVFVTLAATTMLVITVVKTSLALSLGLVGALSIIRFRTPIKEPEELVYLFLAIGLGLGFGAANPDTAWGAEDLRVITTVVLAGILIYLALIGSKGAGTLPPRVLLHVAGEVEEGDARALDRVLDAVREIAPRVDLRRVDRDGTRLEATLVLDLDRPEEVSRLVERAGEALPGGTVSVVDGSSFE
ncbi:MAG TPA: DUF4956 domain-containing protein [Planctomycetes bacterium]|nr:DUF4956 domain-containing protein [Planctomycetota bacterium]